MEHLPIYIIVFILQGKNQKSNEQIPRKVVEHKLKDVPADGHTGRQASFQR